MEYSNWEKELTDKEIVIWGASIGGTQAFRRLKKSGLKVKAYCDNNAEKQGKSYNGTQIISPELLKKMTMENDKYVIIIASFAFETIYRQIKLQGIVCEVYLYLLYDPCHIKSGRNSYTASEREEMKRLYDADPYTNHLLDLIVKSGFLNVDTFGRIEEYTGFGGIDAYYYDNIKERCFVGGGNITLLDVGSYTGDSILQMQRVFGERIGLIYGFEPSRENWERIEKKSIEGLVLHKVGLSNRNGEAYFSEEGPFFRISGNRNGIPVKIARLDDLDLEIRGRCILKIDIEGSEMDCLEGAQEFIRRYRPYIAVCVYHREKDILHIPQFLKGVVPEYHFVIRGGMHAVCYAFPEEE